MTFVGYVTATSIGYKKQLHTQLLKGAMFFSIVPGPAFALSELSGRLGPPILRGRRILRFVSSDACAEQYNKQKVLLTEVAK